MGRGTTPARVSFAACAGKQKKRDGGSDEMKDAEKLALIRKLAERGREICDDDGTQVDTLLECVIMVIDAEEVFAE